MDVLERRMIAKHDVDIKEYADHFLFLCDVPGLKAADIKVRIHNDSLLVIRGERQEKSESLEMRFVHKGRRVPRRHYIKYNLSSACNVEKVDAVLEYGVLAVTVPKLPPEQVHTPVCHNVNVQGA